MIIDENKEKTPYHIRDSRTMYTRNEEMTNTGTLTKIANAHIKENEREISTVECVSQKDHEQMLQYKRQDK